MAGDPLADLIFGIVNNQIACEVNQFMVDAGFALQIPWCGSISPLRPPSGNLTTVDDTSFVDDMLVIAEPPDNAHIAGTIASVTAAIVDIFLEHGLTLNFSPGKSEVIPFIFGQGSKQAKKDLYIDGKAQVVATSRHIGTFTILVVQRYKHVGSVLSSHGSMRPEFAARAGAALAAIMPLKKRIVANRNIPIKTRKLIVDALGMSRLFYNACVWSKFSKSEFEAIQVAHGKMFRGLFHTPSRITRGGQTLRSGRSLPCRRHWSTCRSAG